MDVDDRFANARVARRVKVISAISTRAFGQYWSAAADRCPVLRQNHYFHLPIFPVHVPDCDIYSVPASQMFRELFCHIDRAVLAAGAAGRHQILNPRRWYAETLESTSDITLARN